MNSSRISAEPNFQSKYSDSSFKDDHVHSIRISMEVVLHINDKVYDIRIIDVVQREIFFLQ